jgi:hypothetical protein
MTSASARLNCQNEAAGSGLAVPEARLVHQRTQTARVKLQGGWDQASVLTASRERLATYTNNRHGMQQLGDAAAVRSCSSC